MPTPIDSFDSLKSELINKGLNYDARQQLDSLKYEINSSHISKLNFTDEELRTLANNLNSTQDSNLRRSIFKDAISREVNEKLVNIKNSIDTKKNIDQLFDFDIARESINYINNLDSTYVINKHIVISAFAGYARARGYILNLDKNNNIVVTGNTVRQEEIRSLFNSVSDKTTLINAVNENLSPEEKMGYINSQTFSNIQEKMDKLSSTVSTYYNDNQGLKNQVTDLNSKMSELKNTLSESLNKGDVAKTFYAQLEGSIQDLGKKIDTLNKELNNLKNQNKNTVELEKQISNLSNKIVELENKFNSKEYVAQAAQTNVSNYTSENTKSTQSTETKAAMNAFLENPDASIKSFIKDPFAATGDVITSVHPIGGIAIIGSLFYAAFINKDTRKKFWTGILGWTGLKATGMADGFADSFGSFNGDKKDATSAIIKKDGSVQLENGLVLNKSVDGISPYKQGDYWVDPSTGNLYDDKGNQVDKNGAIITDSTEVQVGETKKEKIKAKIGKECKDFDKNYSILENNLSFSNDNISELGINGGKITDKNKLLNYLKKNNLDVYYLQNKADLDKIMIELINSKDETDIKVGDLFIDGTIDWSQTEKNLEELNQLVLSGASDFYILSRAYSFGFVPKLHDGKFDFKFEKGKRLAKAWDLTKYFLNGGPVTNKDASKGSGYKYLFEKQKANTVINESATKQAKEIQKFIDSYQKIGTINSKDREGIVKYYENQKKVLEEIKTITDPVQKLAKLKEFNELNQGTLGKVPYFDNISQKFISENTKYSSLEQEFDIKNLANGDKIQINIGGKKQVILKSKAGLSFDGKGVLETTTKDGIIEFKLKDKTTVKFKFDNITHFNGIEVHQFAKYGKLESEINNFVNNKNPGKTKELWDSIIKKQSNLSNLLNTIGNDFDDGINKKISELDTTTDIEKNKKLANAEKQTAQLDKKISESKKELDKLIKDYKTKETDLLNNKNTTKLQIEELEKSFVKDFQELNSKKAIYFGKLTDTASMFAEAGEINKYEALLKKYPALDDLTKINGGSRSFLSKFSSGLEGKLKTVDEHAYSKIAKGVILIPVFGLAVSGALKGGTESLRMLVDMGIGFVPVFGGVHDLVIAYNENSWRAKQFLGERKMDSTEKLARKGFGVLGCIPLVGAAAKFTKAPKVIDTAHDIVSISRSAGSIATYSLLGYTIYNTGAEYVKSKSGSKSLENADFIESNDI